MKKWSFVFVAAAGALWGSMGLFVRALNEAGLASLQIVGIRAAVTAAALFVYLALFKRDLLKIRLRDLWCFLGTGILSILFFNFCYFTTILQSDLSVAAVLLYTAPSIVIVFSLLLFKEKLTRFKVLALLLSFAGCVCVSGILGGAAPLNAGALLTGLGAGLGYALYTVFSKFALMRGYHALTVTFYTFLIAALGVVWFISPGQILHTVAADTGLTLWSVGLGVFNTVLPYLLYTFALNYMESGKAAILSSVEPVVAALIGIFAFGETPTVETLLGVLLVVASIAVLNLRPGNKNGPDSSCG